MCTGLKKIYAALLAVTFLIHQIALADDEDNNVRVLTEWTEDEQPVRVDCHNLGITGNGFGGAHISCGERLSLYAKFNCFPMKRESVEGMCPDWEGLQWDVDWERVAELIDARAAAQEERQAHLERLAREREERTSTDR